jgi:hypothetical protein
VGRVRQRLARLLQRGGLGELLRLLGAALALGDRLLQHVGVLDEVVLDDPLDRLALGVGEGGGILRAGADGRTERKAAGEGEDGNGAEQLHRYLEMHVGDDIPAGASDTAVPPAPPTKLWHGASAAPTRI